MVFTLQERANGTKTSGGSGFNATSYSLVSHSGFTKETGFNNKETGFNNKETKPNDKETTLNNKETTFNDKETRSNNKDTRFTIKETGYHNKDTGYTKEAGFTINPCIVEDLFNGTYRIYCTMYSAYITVVILLQYVDYNAYKGPAVAIDQLVFNQTLCVTNSTEVRKADDRSKLHHVQVHSQTDNHFDTQDHRIISKAKSHVQVKCQVKNKMNSQDDYHIHVHSHDNSQVDNRVRNQGVNGHINSPVQCQAHSPINTQATDSIKDNNHNIFGWMQDNNGALRYRSSDGTTYPRDNADLCSSF